MGRDLSKLSREERKIQQYIRSFEKLETRKKNKKLANSNPNSHLNTPSSPKKKTHYKTRLIFFFFYSYLLLAFKFYYFILRYYFLII